MGLGSNVGRRPHFGRSPPLAVAFLAICCLMLVLSYWRVSVQYNELDRNYQRLAQKKDSLEANEKFISQQLELREENFSKAKVTLQQKEQEAEETRRRIETSDQRVSKLTQEADTLKTDNVRWCLWFVGEIVMQIFFVLGKTSCRAGGKGESDEGPRYGKQKIGRRESAAK